MLASFVIILAVILIAAIGVGIRLFFLKDAAVRGTCASQSPFLNKEGESCSYCGKPAGEKCDTEIKSA